MGGRDRGGHPGRAPVPVGAVGPGRGVRRPGRRDARAVVGLDHVEQRPGDASSGGGSPKGGTPGRGLRPGEGPSAMTSEHTTVAAPAAADELTRTPLLTHEVGSLDKLSWRVKSVAGKALDDADLEVARAWGERVGVPDYPELIEILRRAPLTDPADKEAVKRWSSRYAIRMEESAGLDVVYDGEQQRSEMYAWAVAHTNGFEWRGTVRAFDNKYYSKAA